MRIHPRVAIVNEARAEIQEALLAALNKHALTFGEIFTILSEITLQWATYQIRSERHPEDPSKRGSEA